MFVDLLNQEFIGITKSEHVALRNATLLANPYAVHPIDCWQQSHHLATKMV